MPKCDGCDVDYNRLRGVTCGHCADKLAALTKPNVRAMLDNVSYSTHDEYNLTKAVMSDAARLSNRRHAGLWDVGNATTSHLGDTLHVRQRCWTVS